MSELDLPQDYEDLLRDLVSCEVEFLLIGGWAVAVHGHGRATDDMDIFVRASRKNAKRVLAALRQYGAPLQSHGVTAATFSREKDGYRMGRKPLMIEILTKIDGVTFDVAVVDSVKVSVGGLEVPVISRRALLVNKRAAGRAKDLADVEALERESDD